jgi:hypothetical protein
MEYSKAFITGYDSNTLWMFDWMQKNLKEHTDIPLISYDFDKFKAPINNSKNWFKKPFAMIEASKSARQICWIDLDCHVLGEVDGIFDYIEPNKLAMAEDKPWSTRRGETWHNSGVVAFEHRPNILDEWCAAISMNQTVGDQEVLHELLKPGLRKLIHISELPRKYNTLRLDRLDKTMPKKVSIMHWTGPKGKEQIKKQMISETTQ